MLVSLLNISFISVARISLENATDVETLGIFSSATMPAIILIQLSSFIFTPLVNLFSQSFSEGNMKQFNRLFMLTCGALIFVVAVGLTVVIIAGSEILRLVFGELIVPYAYLLTEAFVVAVIASLLSLLITALTIMRKLKVILAGCAIGFLCCILPSQWLISAYGISGANYMQMFGVGISTFILALSYSIYSVK
jgi:O-antigen/teichoic acid export membrane protein